MVEKKGPRIAFWVLILIWVMFWFLFWFHFGRGFGALDFVCNCRGPKRCPKMEPETNSFQPKKEEKLGRAKLLKQRA